MVELTDDEKWKLLTALSDLSTVVEEFYVLFGALREEGTQTHVPRHAESTGPKAPDWS